MIAYLHIEEMLIETAIKTEYTNFSDVLTVTNTIIVKIKTAKHRRKHLLKYFFRWQSSSQSVDKSSVLIGKSS